MGWVSLPARRGASGLVGSGGGRTRKTLALRIAKVLAELATSCHSTVASGEFPAIIEKLPVSRRDRGDQRCNVAKKYREGGEGGRERERGGQREGWRERERETADRERQRRQTER